MKATQGQGGLIEGGRWEAYLFSSTLSFYAVEPVEGHLRTENVQRTVHIPELERCLFGNRDSPERGNGTYRHESRRGCQVRQRRAIVWNTKMGRGIPCQGRRIVSKTTIGKEGKSLSVREVSLGTISAEKKKVRG